MDITKVLKILKDMTALEIEVLDINFDNLYTRYERLCDEIEWWERFMKYCHTGK